MAFVQRLADLQQWHLCLKMDRLDMLQKQSYNRDERLDILKTFKEQHEALLESCLQRTLQAFYEFRSHVNKMVNNMDVLEEHLKSKIQERN